MGKNHKLPALLLALLLLFCAGCGGRKANDHQPLTLSIWHVYGGQTDSPLNDLIETFNHTVGKEKGIQVEVTMVSNNNNIHKDILAGANGEPGAQELPDIFVAYPKTVLAMPDESVLVDYRDYFTEEELSAFVPEFLADGTVNGRLVSLPVAKSTELMFVNKTAFDRFAAATGASLDDLKTWEGLYATACQYAAWTDAKTPDIPDDSIPFFVHDFHFNYFQVGVESLGEDFFRGEELAFGPVFERVWTPYARAALSGGVWLQGGYATEPLRTGESIVSVASSASVLYFSDEVIYADNTTETVELIVLPCPVFEGGAQTVMQRGAGMCTVKSTPEREQAAITFLKWLTEPACNTEFVTSAGYMPVLREAFDGHLPQTIGELSDPTYAELYKAYLETQKGYAFYTAPQLESYLETETAFEETIRLQMRSGRKAYLEAGSDPALLDSLIGKNLEQFKDVMNK